MLALSVSGISRESKRNTCFPSDESESRRHYRLKRLKTGRYYIAGSAQCKADRRRLSCDGLWSWMEDRLGRGWSPLLISGRLCMNFSDDALMRVCPKTISRWIYSSGSRRDRWARCLPRVHRRRRGGRKVPRFTIPGRTPIRERPFEH